MSTLRYIQGMGAYMMISDNAAHLFFANVPDAYNLLVKKAIQDGMTADSWETTWGCFTEFFDETPYPSNQTFLISLSSSWDWFIDQLGGFISYCEGLNQNNEEKLLSRLLSIHKKPVEEQFKLLEKVIPISDVSSIDKDNISELFLIRNLGMHNGWVVDKEYLDKSQRHGLKEGMLIEINSNIVLPLQKSLIDVITKLTTIVASKYANFPDYN